MQGLNKELLSPIDFAIAIRIELIILSEHFGNIIVLIFYRMWLQLTKQCYCVTGWNRTNTFGFSVRRYLNSPGQLQRQILTGHTKINHLFI